MKKQRPGREAKKEEIKSKKRGTTTLRCSLGENRLQRSRFRLGRTIICTHEQTAKPTIHALADPSCRHVLCLAHLPTHRLFLPGMPFLPTSICPPQPTWPALAVAFCKSCLTRSVPSACTEPSRLIIDCRGPSVASIHGQRPDQRGRTATGALVNWGSHNARCQNGPPRLIPLPQSPNLDSLCLAPLQHGPSRRTCSPKQQVSRSLSRSSPRHSNIQRGAARYPFGSPPSPSFAPQWQQRWGRHIILPVTSPRQRSIPVHRCLLARMPPTDRQPPKTDGPQPVTSVCYFFDLGRGLDRSPSGLPPLPCTCGIVTRAGGGG